MRLVPHGSLVLISALLVACQLPASAPRLSGGGMDMFTPTKMRIHPLSRIVYPAAASTEPATLPANVADTRPILEARIELSDQFGDPTKGAGTLVLQLVDTSASLLGRKALGVWNFSIDTPETNTAHWDRTTRTYLFKIPLPADFPAPNSGHDHFELLGTFTLPNNASLSDSLELPSKG